jgi:hypothetical protein
MTFIRTNRGHHIALAAIERVTDDKRGGRDVEVYDGRDGELGTGPRNSIDEHIVQIISPQGEWERLRAFDGEVDTEAEDSVEIIPIIAWGLTPTGHVVPVTPDRLQAGSHGEGRRYLAVRKKMGDATIWTDDDHQFSSVAAWIKHLRAMDTPHAKRPQRTGT